MRVAVLLRSLLRLWWRMRLRAPRHEGAGLVAYVSGGTFGPVAQAMVAYAAPRTLPMRRLVVTLPLRTLLICCHVDARFGAGEVVAGFVLVCRLLHGMTAISTAVRCVACLVAITIGGES